LEAWVKDEDSDVDYRRILEAPVSREFVSINGIFPKIVRNFPSLMFVLETQGPITKADRRIEEEGGRRKTQEGLV
jgi:hypothetical protein